MSYSLARSPLRRPGSADKQIGIVYKKSRFCSQERDMSKANGDQTGRFCVSESKGHRRQSIITPHMQNILRYYTCIYIFVYDSLHVNIHHINIYLIILHYIYLSIYLSTYLSIYLSISVYKYIHWCIMFVSGHPTDTSKSPWDSKPSRRNPSRQALTSLGVDAPELYRAISDKAMQCLQAIAVLWISCLWMLGLNLKMLGESSQ